MGQGIVSVRNDQRNEAGDSNLQAGWSWEAKDSRRLETTPVYPNANEGEIHSSDMYRYQWTDWDMPQYHERLKKSYYIMKDLYGKISINDSNRKSGVEGN